MDRFVSHYLLKLDAKGRISVPASFRAVLARDGFDGLYCCPALDRPALEAGGNALLSEIEQLIAGYPPFSEEREQFATALYGTSETMKMDGEGRVTLSDSLEGPCRHHGCRGLHRLRPQISDLGARSLRRATFRGHRKAPRAQETFECPGCGRERAWSDGNDDGPRGRETGCPLADWPVTFPCSAARRSNFSIRATAASMSTAPSAPAVIAAPSSRSAGRR